MHMYDMSFNGLGGFESNNAARVGGSTGSAYNNNNFMNPSLIRVNVTGNQYRQTPGVHFSYENILDYHFQQYI